MVKNCKRFNNTLHVILLYIRGNLGCFGSKMSRLIIYGDKYR